MQQLGNTRVRTTWNWRSRAIGTARLSFNAASPRQGAIIRQTRRCLTASNGVASIRSLLSWAYAGQPTQHWHYKSVYRALARLGARRALAGAYMQHTRNMRNKSKQLQSHSIPLPGGPRPSKKPRPTRKINRRPPSNGEKGVPGGLR